MRTMVVQSLALSVIYYCLPIYGLTSNTLLHRVQKLQNFEAKICVSSVQAKVTPDFVRFVRGVATLANEGTFFR